MKTMVECSEILSPTFVQSAGMQRWPRPARRVSLHSHDLVVFFSDSAVSTVPSTSRTLNEVCIFVRWTPLGILGENPRSEAAAKMEFTVRTSSFRKKQAYV